jgi:hypothetical protein
MLEADIVSHMLERLKKASNDVQATLVTPVDRSTGSQAI